MQLVFYHIILVATLLGVCHIEIANARTFNPEDESRHGDTDYVDIYQPDWDYEFTYDDKNNNFDDKIIKTNIRNVLEKYNLETNLKNYQRTRHHDRKKLSSDYINDGPYTSVNFDYHDDINEKSANDLETDEHVKRLFHAIENNELLELYVECAKFSKLKEQYYQKRVRYEKKRFNRQVFDEIENFCEFIKTDDVGDFII